MMNFTVQQIADLLHGTIDGNGDAMLCRLDKIEDGAPGGLSFLANAKYIPYIYQTQATAVIVSQDFKPEQPIAATLIRVQDAYQAFAKLLELYEQMMGGAAKSGVSSLAFLSPSAKTGKEVFVGEFAYIGEHVEIGDHVQIYPQVYIGDHVKIADHTIIYPGVKIYHGCEIGKHCTIHAGTVIGADGFGFAPNNGVYNKVPQIGNVVLEDHVEIGANACVDRATMGSTVIKQGVKLDNLIQIAHNVVVGENTVMASQVGISGSTKVGKNCMLGGQVGLAGHIQIADGVKLAAQSGVPNSLKEENGVYFGSPAMDAADYRRSFVYFKNFDQIVKRLNELERQVKQFTDGK